MRVCLAWLLLLAGTVCAAPAPTMPLELSGLSMGTTWHVKLVSPPFASAAVLRSGIQSTLDRIDGQMSTYKPDSDLARFNAAPAETWQTLPSEFFDVLQRALRLARDSDGAYDPTVGALVDLWGFGPVQRPHEPPTKAAIRAARRHVGWWRLKLDPPRQRAWQPGGVHLDLSSIAKGYAVDEVARWLEHHGVAAYLVEIGGELRAGGRKPDGSDWFVVIEASSDDAPGDDAPTLALRDAAVATSGDYRRFFTHDGNTFSHHIDPRNGLPVSHRVASVTVVARHAVDADPLGTLLSVLGPEKGMDYALRHGLAVLMRVHGIDGVEEHRSPAFDALMSH